MPYSHLPKEKAEALEALERLLLRHKLVGEEQARRAARLITGDEGFLFPQPRVAPEHTRPQGEDHDAEAAPSTE